MRGTISPSNAPLPRVCVENSGSGGGGEGGGGVGGVGSDATGSVSDGGRTGVGGEGCIRRRTGGGAGGGGSGGNGRRGDGGDDGEGGVAPVDEGGIANGAVWATAQPETGAEAMEVPKV